MQEAAQSESSPNASTFAALLAALTAPKPNPGDSWADGDLQDDVATLSYERALRTHARYRAGDSAAGFDELGVTEEPGFAAPTNSESLSEPARIHAGSAPDSAPAPVRRSPAAFERNLKSASVTIRMSQAEREQLHQRAAEAGLTISAYLRSCTFEAESLRALVRETLTQLKQATVTNKQTVQCHSRRFGWLNWIIPGVQGAGRVARA